MNRERLSVIGAAVSSALLDPPDSVRAIRRSPAPLAVVGARVALALAWSAVLYQPSLGSLGQYAIGVCVMTVVCATSVGAPGFVLCVLLYALEVSIAYKPAATQLGNLVVILPAFADPRRTSQGDGQWRKAEWMILVVGLLVLGGTLVPVFPGGAALAVWGRFALAVAIQSTLVLALRRNQAVAVEAAVAVERGQQDERLRIARELHDVVAHRMSAVVIQAQAAQSVVATRPEVAVERMAAIERESRSGLNELRGLLGALRSEEVSVRAEHEVEQPQARLDQATLNSLGATPPDGVEHVATTVQGDLERVPSTVSLQALRILQEALANASRHAPGSQVSVTVYPGVGVLDLEVVSVGGGPSKGGGTGVGLLGMRERAHLLGGSLEAGPRADGAWLVSASLPWDA